MVPTVLTVEVAVVALAESSVLLLAVLVVLVVSQKVRLGSVCVLALKFKRLKLLIRWI